MKAMCGIHSNHSFLQSSARVSHGQIRRALGTLKEKGISNQNGGKTKRTVCEAENVIWCVCGLSHGRLFATPWTVAHQAPLSRGFSRQEYWSGLPFPSPGDLPDPRIEPIPPLSPTLAGRFFTTEPPILFGGSIKTSEKS